MEGLEAAGEGGGREKKEWKERGTEREGKRERERRRERGIEGVSYLRKLQLTHMRLTAGNVPAILGACQASLAVHTAGEEHIPVQASLYPFLQHLYFVYHFVCFIPISHFYSFPHFFILSPFFTCSQSVPVHVPLPRTGLCAHVQTARRREESRKLMEIIYYEEQRVREVKGWAVLTCLCQWLPLLWSPPMDLRSSMREHWTEDGGKVGERRVRGRERWLEHGRREGGKEEKVCERGRSYGGKGK